MNELIRELAEALEAMQSYARAENKGLRICDEAIAKARAYLETGGWTRVEDGLPVVPEGLDHVEIFFFCAQDSGRRVGRRLWLDVDTALSHGITHWRYAEPTPEPPKG